MTTILFALISIAQTSQDEETARRWIEKLRSDSIEERDEAARKLRALGKKAVPELEKAAKTLDLAAHLLKVIALTQEIPEIARKFPGAEERLVLGGDRAWTELFLKVWAHEKEGDPSLATLPPGERTILVRRAFAGMLDEEDGGKIIGAVRTYKIVEAIPQLAKVLAAKDDGWHNLSLATLGELGSPAAVPLIIAGLKEPKAEVRGTAVYALHHLGGKESVEALLTALRDPSSGVRYRATSVLGWRDAKESVPALVARLADDEAQVRVAALEALDRLGATDSIKEIQPLLKDPRAPVRLRAAATLSSLGSREGVALFLDMKKDPKDYELSHQFDNTRYSGRFLVPGFEVLNGLRQPEGWRRLKETKFGCTGFKGTNREALEKAAKIAKLAIEIRTTVSDMTNMWLDSDYSGGGDWMPDTLLRVLESGRYDGLRLVVESDRICFLLAAEEAEFWTGWWREEQKK